jgi:hypothetical protein
MTRWRARRVKDARASGISLELMEALRTVPVFDAQSVPQSWNSRMQAGEAAVMLADARTGSPVRLDGSAVMDVNAADVFLFANAVVAEAWSRAQVQRLPELRCRIYDHHGLADQPLEIKDPRYQKHDGFSRKTSVHIGLGLLGTGVTLCVAEWISDFHLSWAAMIGARLLPVGLLLLVTEAGLRLNDWDKRRRDAASCPIAFGSK